MHNGDEKFIEHFGRKPWR